ncbi:MAG: DNRLRE domain-containing protein [Candidatus Goldbacteria bacterium]|nr:DNRLRE domain-containing protein [Candidatus Goldiibacteriota bacterium]
MKKNFLFIILIITGLILLSCKGDPGPAGAVGEDGKPLYVQMFQNQVYPNSLYQDVSDNYIIDFYPNNNYGECDNFILMSSSIAKSRITLKFINLENFIPANVTITNAYLVLYGGNAITYTVSSICAYKLTKDWTEGTGTCVTPTTTNSSWTNYSGSFAWTIPGGDFDTTPVSDAVKINTFQAYYSLKLKTELIKEWIQSPITNYGVLIKAVDETKNSVMYFASSENTADLTWRPKLFIYYTIP